MEYYMYCIGLTLLGLMSCTTVDNRNERERRLITVNYTGSNELFPNPERGFYHYTESRVGSSPTPLKENTLKSYRRENISLIYRIYYLKDFKNKPISSNALQQIDEDMAMLRASGLKCILRFAYASERNEADAPLDIILQHLEQLKPCFEKNVDVIALLQAGFIGAWGEWYYSSNNLKTPLIRAAILDKIMEVLPARRMIQVRTPAYKTEYIRTKTPLSSGDAFSGTKAARIGHHNDCFMASADDYGTYTSNMAEEKNYIGSEGIYLPVGGETCPPSGIDPADCLKAEGEMRRLRWSFLNEDYYKGVNDRWKTAGCMDNIIRELGYRFVLNAGTYDEKAVPGGEMQIELTINNTGYACPYNPRKMEFVFRNPLNGNTYIFPVDEDPRFWKPQTETKLTFTIGLPRDIDDGGYDLYLHLPDPEPLLYARAEYAVRFANDNLWEEKTGYNNLKHQVKIARNASAH
ncbi:MAG: DUF4832 domain-containing protein [Tannerella sp.]|nr:DUF4832 domain-containing protein [Tannerella sp.]